MTPSNSVLQLSIAVGRHSGSLWRLQLNTTTLGGQKNVPGVVSVLVIHWHMVNQDEFILLAG